MHNWEKLFLGTKWLSRMPSREQKQALSAGCRVSQHFTLQNRENDTSLFGGNAWERAEENSAKSFYLFKMKTVLWKKNLGRELP